MPCNGFRLEVRKLGTILRILSSRLGHVERVLVSEQGSHILQEVFRKLMLVGVSSLEKLGTGSN